MNRVVKAILEDTDKLEIKWKDSNGDSSVTPAPLSIPDIAMTLLQTVNAYSRSLDRSFRIRDLCVDDIPRLAGELTQTAFIWSCGDRKSVV